MTPRHAFFFALTAVFGAYACTLDFSKWEGAAPGGSGGSQGGSGGDPTTTTATTTTSSTGGMGGVGGSAGAGGVPASCTNGMMDGTETDEDCGGDLCPACDNGETCVLFSDCTSLYCNAGTCEACAIDANCADATDTWCDTAMMGGTCVALKDNGASCGGGNECTSTICTENVCCDGSCGLMCESCLGTKNASGTAGACGPIAGTTDPDGECGAQVCDGGNGCADLCGLEPNPPGGACPAECANCNGDICTIQCTSATCATVTCPPGFACNVVCDSMSECQGSVINCPDNYACNVSCAGNSACRSATVNCSTTGTCNMTCSADPNVCRDSSMLCGDNECGAVCAGGSNFPDVMCNVASSCTCTECT